MISYFLAKYQIFILPTKRMDTAVWLTFDIFSNFEFYLLPFIVLIEERKHSIYLYTAGSSGVAGRVPIGNVWVKNIGLPID